MRANQSSRIAHFVGDSAQVRRHFFTHSLASSGTAGAVTHTDQQRQSQFFWQRCDGDSQSKVVQFVGHSTVSHSLSVAQADSSPIL